jgi:hypothetical protein
MKNEQIELSFNVAACRRPHRAPSRRARAQWWFSQMRQAVARAVDWTPAPPSPPEQTHLTLARPR